MPKKILKASRRELFGLGAALTVAGSALTFGSSASAVGNKKTSPGHDGTLQLPENAVATTGAGDVRGYRRNAIYTFKGIPYGDTTGGMNRFAAPQPPKAWDGVRWSLNYGPVSPPGPSPFDREVVTFVSDNRPGVEREDCLRANVWSPTLGTDAKLPVMVWFHGGGFTSGSGHEVPAYNGENLAKKGVVVVSVNHRLGPLGFMDMSAYGLKKGANAGLLDLVLALKWVRENVASFGGDPDQVTIFGHSGGGGKVSALMAMPEAKGLFHKAIVLSGSFPVTQRTSHADKLAAAMFPQFGLKEGDVAGLQEVDTHVFVKGAYAAATDLSRKVFGAPKGLFSPSIGFGPSLNDDLPEAWEKTAPSISKDIPLIVGSTRDEFREPGKHYTEASLVEAVPMPFRKNAQAIIASVQAALPGLSVDDIGATIGALFLRKLSLEQAHKHYQLGGAPAYNYWYTWSSPLLDGAIGSPHGADLFAVFDNAGECEQFTGNTPASYKMADVMSDAMVSFAKTGKPQVKGATWDAYNPETVPAMIFDNRSRLAHNPAGDAIKLMG